MQPLIIFMDSGDTLVDESTEVRDRPGGVVRSCSLFPGATEAIRSLWRKGYCIELVADGLVSSFLNIYQQQGLTECFAAWTVSEAVGAEKPDPRMFRTAFRNLGLSEDAETKQRVVMVGNNVLRDIRRSASEAFLPDGRPGTTTRFTERKNAPIMCWIPSEDWCL